MNIAVFQHTPGETLGFFETIFAEKSIPYEYIRLYETNELPENAASRLIFLGGPMSVNDEKEFPYLKQEKELIRKAVREKRQVLGICLGAQLIASAFGAKVYSYVQETGWYQIRCEPAAKNVFPLFPERFFAFQLHRDTFELPSAGRLLCSGDPVKNQAFVLGSAIGMQFHPEITEEIVQDWSRDFSRTQRERILNETPGFIPESNRLCHRVSEYFIRHEPE